MTAYRLHFEPANLDALKIVTSGKIGEARFMTSDFSYQVTDLDNIRLKAESGGGAIWDIGIYCNNAARTLMRAEPEEVFAYRALRAKDPRFKEVPETFAVMMKFPGEKFASFTCSFGADTSANYHFYGTKGAIRVEESYEYATPRKLLLMKDGKTVKTKRYKKADQFAPEILYFSDCVLTGKDPEPSASEGLNDVKIIRAIIQSSESGRPVAIRKSAPHVGPNRGMKKNLTGHGEPNLVNATGASS